MQIRYFAGVDLGATKITVILADLEQSIIKESRITEKTDVEGDDFPDYQDGIAYYEVSRQIERMLREKMKECEIAGNQLAAIGVGSAGPLSEGTIKDSTHIKPRHIPPKKRNKVVYIPLAKPLKEEFDIPVKLENDCTAGVLGEVYYGVGKGKDESKLHIVYVTLSTGFGAGVWDGGRLLRGKHGNAAEVGHFFVKEDGRFDLNLRCGCGNYGCAEAYCSGTGITKNTRMQLVNEDLRFEHRYGSIVRELALQEAKQDERFERKDPSDWEVLEFITSPIVFDAAKKGDGLGQKVIDQACYYGGIAFANIANAYNPEMITVGGALAIENSEIIEPIREEMERHLNVEAPAVMVTPLEDRVVEYGAIVLAREALEYSR